MILRFEIKSKFCHEKPFSAALGRTAENNPQTGEKLEIVGLKVIISKIVKTQKNPSDWQARVKMAQNRWINFKKNEFSGTRKYLQKPKLNDVLPTDDFQNRQIWKGVVHRYDQIWAVLRVNEG